MPKSSSFVIVSNRHQPSITMGFIIIIILGLEFITSTIASRLNDK